MPQQSIQGTIKKAIAFEGKGLHTGKYVKISIKPASKNTGIIFHQVDRKGNMSEIQANWKYIKYLPLCTCVSKSNKVYVRTIEHLMAAFYACGIDNAIIEVNGSELPILDGSAGPYVDKIIEVGINTQRIPRKNFVVQKTVEINTGDRHIILEPFDGFFLDLTTILKQFGHVHWNGIMTPDYFRHEVSYARTFGELRDGLLAQLSRFSTTPVCLGANTKTAIVIGRNKRILNKNGLRMPDEFIRHRILDLVGDMMLTGGHIQGKITALGSAHRLTHELIKKAFKEKALVLKEL